METTSLSPKKKKVIEYQIKIEKIMTTHFVDPGGGPGDPPTYAKRLKITKFEQLNRNVLEIVLEKKVTQKNVTISGEEVSRVCHMARIKVGDEPEGYQAHYVQQEAYHYCSLC